MSNLLGAEGDGLTIAQERLGPGRIHHCMRWLEIAGRAFDLLCERADERVITASGETLADRQVIQHWVAELDADIRAARLLTLHAAWVIDCDGADEVHTSTLAPRRRIDGTVPTRSLHAARGPNRRRPVGGVGTVARWPVWTRWRSSVPAPSAPRSRTPA